MGPLPLLQSTTRPASLANFCCFTPFFPFPDYKAWSQATSNIFVLALGRCLLPRRLSFDENVRAKEGGKETTVVRLYPSHGPLRFITSHSRFALASAMRKTKGLRRRLPRTCKGGWHSPPLHSVFENFIKKILSGHMPISVAVRLSLRPIYCDFFVKIVLYIRKIKNDEWGVLYGLILKDTKELRL